MRVKVKKGYILLTDTRSVLTRLIRLYTKEPYNHASIAFDPELTEVYSFGRKSERNPFIGGFVKEDLKSRLLVEANCAIYSFEATEEQLEKMREYVREMAKRKNQYRYNFLGLFGFIINRPIDRKNHFFCSQFVASVLAEGHVLMFSKPLALIAPSDFRNLVNLELVYQGRLMDYKFNRKIVEDHHQLDLLASKMNRLRHN